MKPRAVRPNLRNKPSGGSAEGVDVGNPSSGSYWVRDDVGPSHLVTSRSGADDIVARDVAVQVSEALSAKLSGQCEWPDQAITVEVIEGEVFLTGTVTSDVISRAAQRCATAATDLPVRNALVLQ
jgi:hypothetical protein